jgi:GNAT superfamily N-acetyltransferase
VDYAIRPAMSEDAGTLLALIDALADYEHLPRPDAEARRRLVDHAFDGQQYFQALLLEAAGQAVAYALYFYTYSSFLARPTLYLEDVFVLPDHRHHGYGTAIMRHLVQQALDAGCGRLEWQVLHWNRLAIDFYERLGAKHLADWLPYRLAREDMEAVLT